MWPTGCSYPASYQGHLSACLPCHRNFRRCCSWGCYDRDAAAQVSFYPARSSSSCTRRMSRAPAFKCIHLGIALGVDEILSSGCIFTSWVSSPEQRKVGFGNFPQIIWLWVYSSIPENPNPNFLFKPLNKYSCQYLSFAFKCCLMFSLK